MATFENLEHKDKIMTEPFLRLQGYSAIINSDIDGGHMLGYMTKWINSHIGKYTGMGSFSFMSNATVGSYCTFGSRVSIGAFSHPTNWFSIHEFQYRDTSQIYGESILHGGVNKLSNIARDLTLIGSDVWIGDNSVVKRGTRIGTGSIIGHSTAVTRDVPPYAIVVGNPGKIVKFRFENDIIVRLLRSEWWKLSMSKFRDFDFSDIESVLSIIENENNLNNFVPTDLAELEYYQTFKKHI